MKPGDMVRLIGSMWSSYEREGEVGLLLESSIMNNRSGYPNAEFSRVFWGTDSPRGKISICKTSHLEVLNENR